MRNNLPWPRFYIQYRATCVRLYRQTAVLYQTGQGVRSSQFFIRVREPPMPAIARNPKAGWLRTAGAFSSAQKNPRFANKVMAKTWCERTRTLYSHFTVCPEFCVRSILGAARVPACWSWVRSWLARPTARRRWPGGRFTSVCASAVRYEHHLYDHCLHCGLCLGFGILLAADAGLLETLHGHAILRSHAWKYAVMRNAPHVENRSVMPSRPFSDWFALRGVAR